MFQDQWQQTSTDRPCVPIVIIGQVHLLLADERPDFVNLYPLARQVTAYAWSSPVEGSAKRRFFAVLHVPPITSPVEAVSAAIVAEQ